MTNRRAAKIIVMTSCLMLQPSEASFGKDTGGGAKASAGLEASIHPAMQSWVQGEKDRARYMSTGGGWLLYLTDHEGPKSGLSWSVPTFAVWADYLENSYEETDPSGAKARETMNAQGIGLGYVGHDASTWLAMAAVIGAERLTIDQSGDSPRSQKYPYGFSSRLGLGINPIQGSFALDVRVDWRFKHFPSVKSGGDSLKSLQQQSFTPVISVSYNR